MFWLTLSCWIALVVAPGLTGITAFKVLEAEEASIPRYQAFFADDPEGMSRLAAGLVTDPLFRITSLLQWLLAPLAVVLCLILVRARVIMGLMGCLPCLPHAENPFLDL